MTDIGAKYEFLLDGLALKTKSYVSEDRYPKSALLSLSGIDLQSDPKINLPAIWMNSASYRSQKWSLQRSSKEFSSLFSYFGC